MAESLMTEDAESKQNNASIIAVIDSLLSEADYVIRDEFSQLDEDQKLCSNLTQEDLEDALAERLRQVLVAKPRLKTKLTNLVKQTFSADDILDESVQPEHRCGSSSRQEIEHDELETDLLDCCCDNVLRSAKYREMQNVIKDAVANYIDQNVVRRQLHQVVCNNTIDHEELCRLSLGSRDSLVTSYSVADGCETNSVASSYNTEYNWDMLSSHTLQEIVDRLHPLNSWQVQQEGLRMLSSLPLHEVVNCPVEWPELKIRLQHMLVGSSWPAFSSAVKFHQKMLHSTATMVVIEGYLNLLETSTFLFTQKPEHLFEHCHNLRHINTDSQRQTFVLANNINTFLKFVPCCWSRFPESHLQAMIEHTMRYHRNIPRGRDTSPEFDSPLLVVALVDLRAEWFRKWILSSHIRRKVIQTLEHDVDVLNVMTEYCLESFSLIEQHDSPGHDVESEEPDSGYSAVGARYAFVVYSVSFLGYLLLTSDGRGIFNAQVEPVLKITATDFLTSALKASFLLTDHVETCSRSCLTQVITDLLNELVSNEVSCRRCLADGQLLASIFDPLRCWLDGPRDKLVGVTGNDLHLLEHVTSILFSVIDSCDGIHLLLETGSVTTITTFAEKLLLVHEEFLPSCRSLIERIKTTMVKICCRLLADHDGFDMLSALPSNNVKVLIKYFVNKDC